MTDLQVKYQSYLLEKEKLAEDKRLHDAQIGEYSSRAAKQTAETSKLSKEEGKILSEIKLLEKDIAWYDTTAVANAANKWLSGFGSAWSGAGSILRGVGSLL